MNTIKRQSVLFTLLLGAFLVAEAQMTDQHANDRQQLLSIMSQVEDALNNKDASAIQKHIHPDAIIMFHDASVAQGTEAILTYFEQKLGGTSAVLSGFHTKAYVDAPAVFYDNTALAYGHTIDHFEFATGNSFDLESKWTAALLKQQDQWLVTSLHFSVNFFDNPLLNTAKNNLLLFSGLAFLLGLVVMFILAKWRLKK